MRILAFTNLFPNRAEPARGLFNLQAFQALAPHCDDLRVVAPVRLLPRALRCGDPDVPVPRHELIGGLPVWHPRYFLVPKLAPWTQAAQLRLGVAPTLARIRREYPFDLLLATWAFPDVVAAAGLARRWGVPLAAKVHGADVNLFTRFPHRRRAIVRALEHARLVLSVTDAMKERLVEIGVPAEKILVQRNGIDGERFQERPRAAARQELQLDASGYHVAYIGTFRPTKGLEVLLEAARRLIAAGVPLTLHLVGDGPHLEPALREQARAGGIADRVRFHGYQPHDRIATWIAATDVLCLPSTSDGCPNIILETLACGRPVVATRVGGIPEILSEEAGVLVPPADPAALAAGLQAALTRAWEPERLRASVIQRSWAKNGADLYQALLAAMPAAPAAPRRRAGRTTPQASP